MKRLLLHKITAFSARCWWGKRNRVNYLLIPFSLIYRAVIAMRYWCYQLGCKKITRFPVPIIIVGNITTGGTGKTPLVIWLCNFLQQQGWRPGVVSRGYGGKQNHQACWVTSASKPADVGDEAILIASQTACPVVIGKRRVQAVKTLLAQSDCNVIISDDGLQHYALARDLEIVVIDSKRRFGNGLCLPAGPLREPRQRLKKADFLIVNGAGSADEFSFQLVMGEIYNLLQPQQTWDKTQIAQPVHAVAGIGHPQRFFALLRESGFIVIEHAFPDHYPYCAEDFQFGDEHPIIMTEKDAVKCLAFADKRFWCLPVSAQPEAVFSSAFVNKFRQITALSPQE